MNCKMNYRIKSSLAVFLVSVLFVLSQVNNLYAQNYNKIDSLEKLLQVSQSDSTKLFIQLQLFGYYYAFDTVKSEQYLSNVIKEVDVEKISPIILFEIGKVYENYKNDYLNAIKYYELASTESKNESDPNFIVYYSWLGYTYSKIGESEKAIEILINAVELAESQKQETKLPRTYLLLAFAYRDLNKLDKAELYFNKSLQVSNTIGDSTDIHTSLHEIGNLYNLKSDYKKAVEFHSKALEIRERMNLINVLVYSYHDISLDYYAMGNLEMALKYAFAAEKLAMQLYEKWLLVSVYSNITEIFIKLKKFNDAEIYLKKLQIFADELKMKSTYNILYQTYYSFYKSQKQFENALKYYELNIAYKDSISNETVQKNISELDKKYESAKKDKEILANQERIRRQQLFITTAIIGFVLVLIFILIIFRQYRQKKQANTKLENQNIEIIRQKEEIRIYAEELKDLNATKDKLFSIIAHDLRSPFTGIQGFSELLLTNLNEFDISETKKFIEHINQSAVSTLDLLDKLLEWAQNQTGQISFNPTNLSFKPIVIEILGILKSSAKFKNISLNFIESDINVVYADQNMLKTILRNLIQNAIKFTNTNGRIDIFSEKKSGYVEITVSDDGIGMNEYTKEKIFEVDKKKTMTGTDDERGIGLGLVICNEFVKKHGGIIRVESELGKGSKFIFTLPVFN